MNDEDDVPLCGGARSDDRDVVFAVKAAGQGLEYYRIFQYRTPSRATQAGGN